MTLLNYTKRFLCLNFLDSPCASTNKNIKMKKRRKKKYLNFNVGCLKKLSEEAKY